LSAARRASEENTIIARKKLARKNFVRIRTLPVLFDLITWNKIRTASSSIQMNGARATVG